MNEVFTLMRGLPVEHELLHTPVDGMNHPLLIIYTNLALKCNTVEEFKDLLNNAK
jgi:hypothetical protein